MMLQATAQAVIEEAAGAEQKKLWGGRFTGATDPLMEKFNESLPFDKRMWREDLKVGCAACCCQQSLLFSSTLWPGTCSKGKSMTWTSM